MPRLTRPGTGPLLRRAVLPWVWLVWLACYAMDASQAADAAPLRLAGVDYLGDLPTVIAHHEGLFARHGLDVEVEFNGSGRDNLERLRAGATDFALMALTPIVLDRLADPSPGQADDPVILASLVHSTRLNHVVVPASGPVEHPADLRGRRVGLRTGTNAEFAWWLFAQFHGFDPAAAERVDYPVAEVPEALRRGDVDAVVIWEPWLSRLRERTDTVFRSLRGSNVYAAPWALVTTRATAHGQPEHSSAVLAAYRDAIASIHRDPEAAITVYARHCGVAEDTLRRNWSALDFGLNLQWSILTSLQQQIAWARRKDPDRTKEPISVLDLIDATPLRALQPSAVGIPARRNDPRPRP